MNKKQRKQQKVKSKRFPIYTVIFFAAIAVVVSLAAFFGVRSLVPVNGNSPVFAAATNTFIKSTHSPQLGWVFTSQSTGGRGKTIGTGYNSPPVILKKGELTAIHLINEDSETHSAHNLNVDAFNVHTKDLGYFQSQTITFIANKIGTFPYYCTIHPEMKGLIHVRE
jgi:plastocyanin